jgi:hypothetical protein
MRGYIVTCDKNGISVYAAIKSLVQGKAPEFIKAMIASDVL